MKSAAKNNVLSENNDLIIVGIGASAGGLEALQDFFKNVPTKSGLAFVVIQHLSPDYKSLMNELLARYTSIPIQVAESGMELMKDNIYLIPPRKNISVFHHKLILEDQSPKKVLNLPIDIFFRSLAIEKGNDAIGIILSGTGSDGTLGTRAIKEAGGMIMVQDDASAKFDGMPKSSIATGLVDYILTPSRMPEALLNYIKHPLNRPDNRAEAILTKNIDSFTKVIMILRDFTGIDFSSYRENTILRRLEKRISINRFGTIDEYIIYLSESDKEKEILFREMLIGVTRFFRDFEAFESIRRNVFPAFKKKKLLRIWSVGCSTGEEAYSLAIMLNEFFESERIECEVKIFATDIDKRSLDQASAGYYADSMVADVDPMLLAKYFIKLENGYQIKESIRQMIVFATHNLIKDPPFSKLDLLICRNLFIYIKPEIQHKILSMFYYSLSPDGFMFLGSSESISEMGDAFDTVDTKWKIFRFKPGFNPPILIDLRSERIRNYEGEAGIYNRLPAVHGIKFDQIGNQLLSDLLPPSVIIDSNDNIVHIISDISHLIKMQVGRFTPNLLDNLPRELSLLISALLRRVRRENLPLLEENIGQVGNSDKATAVAIRTIQTDKANFYVISFQQEKINRKKKKAGRLFSPIDFEYGDSISELQKELQSTKESLQATVEELETSNEELQSSNEELIASNEELQSTNEELQSVNEELYTVNSEYQTKIEELTRLNNDMNNLLVNTQVGALYLDRNLCIRKLTPVVSKLTNIIPSDIGRPIFHISSVTSYSTMIDDIQLVVENLQPIEKEIEFPDGRFYMVDLRPYRTENNTVEGVLITFINITKLKTEMNRADLATRYLNSALSVGNMAWWRWDLQTNKVLMDERKATMIGYTPAEFPSDVYEICKLIHPDDYEATMQNMRDHLEGRSAGWDCTYRIRRKDGSYAWYYDRGAITERDNNNRPLSLIGTVLEVSNLKNLEQELENNNKLVNNLFHRNPAIIFFCDAEGNITFINLSGKTALRIDHQNHANINSVNISLADVTGRPSTENITGFLASRNASHSIEKLIFTDPAGNDVIKDFSVTVFYDEKHHIAGYNFTEVRHV